MNLSVVLIQDDLIFTDTSAKSLFPNEVTFTDSKA